MTNLAQLVIDSALSKGIAISIGTDGTVTIGGASTTQSINPEYVSDTVPDLPRGAVTRQCRQFKRLGATGLVKAHSADTIRAAMNGMGWGSSVQTTNDPYVFRVTRTRLQPRRPRRG